MTAGALGISGSRVFHLAGQLPPPPRLAVVGSRAAERRFREAVGPLVEAAGNVGWSVVSGGAMGIDSDAHRAALAAGVAQLVVLPCGPDQPYPPHHGPLFEQVAAAPRSGVLSCQPPGTVPTRGMFASRNAIVVALSRAVVVVEARPRSGSMITARLAATKGRARAVVAGSAGAAVLVAEGAHALAWRGEAFALRAAARDWLGAVLRGDTLPPPEPKPWPEHLHWLREAVLAAGPAGLMLDDLASPRTALMALVEAEALGLVVERAAGRWALGG